MMPSCIVGSTSLLKVAGLVNLEGIVHCFIINVKRTPPICTMDGQINEAGILAGIGGVEREGGPVNVSGEVAELGTVDC
ncbi:unnamed protein product [Gongylonema pulchrum]|uniref:Uncharacterized protein n=1 Tax=Gongylonema pulchrum TaxID=637853 RepID=A0A183EDK7_9BILA|nr:unnamed protein product [Gongylonema pulchrum]